MYRVCAIEISPALPTLVFASIKSALSIRISHWPVLFNVLLTLCVLMFNDVSLLSSRRRLTAGDDVEPILDFRMPEIKMD